VLREHLTGLGILAQISVERNLHRAVWPVRNQALVSIVIPNRDAAVVLKQCVRGLLDETGYEFKELIIVDNESTDPEVLDLYRALETDGCGRIVRRSGRFNFSAACNAGAAAAHGDLLLFLNNDIEVLEPGWLEELVRWAQLPEVGVVGTKLLYPDRTIQHAGVVFGLGLVGHIFSRASEGTFTCFGSPESYRNYLAVTGACQMMRREVFQQLGGYDERFRLSFSDVVLCMEAWKAGFRVVYTPYARLVHHESYTRRREDSPEDMELLARYLKSTRFVEDPYFHSELDARSPVPAVRPPFSPPPREVISNYVERVLAASEVIAS
jgi:GT2 family glycosyltransferase